jgi:hypothetical protein
MAQAQSAPEGALAEGGIELSNADLAPAAAATEPDVPASANAQGAMAPAEASTANAAAEAPKDPREAYRDAVIKNPEGPLTATTAASRRYKRVDLATYRASMLGTAAPTAPTASGASPGTQ